MVCVALLLFVCVMGAERGRPVHTGKEATQPTPTEMLSITGSAWPGSGRSLSTTDSFRLRRDCIRDSIMVAPLQLEGKTLVDVRAGGG